MSSAVSPVHVSSIFHCHLLVVDDDEGDVGGDEAHVRNHNEDQVVDRAVLVRQYDLAENDSVFQETHQDEPVGDQEMLGLLLTANI